MFVFVGCGITSQQRDDDQVIDGISVFKLGSDVSLIDSINNAEYGTPIKKLYGYKEYHRRVTGDIKDFEIAELFPGDDTEANYASLCKEVRVFHLPYHKISDDLYLKHVILNFYNDSLYEVACRHSSKLERALTEKYGSPAKKKNKDGSYTLNWKTGYDNYECYMQLCGKERPTLSSFLRIYDWNISLMVFDKDMEIEKAKKQEFLDKI